MYTFDEIEKTDSEIADAIKAEMERQNSHIELIASENWVSKAVMAAMGSPLTNDYFSGLVEQAAKQCYGIAAMGQAPAESVVRSALRTGSLPPKGVTVTQEAGKLVIALHIKVGFGLNISTITQSITHRVKDEVELATGLKVARIDVYVDDVIAD